MALISNLEIAQQIKVLTKGCHCHKNAVKVWNKIVAALPNVALVAMYGVVSEACEGDKKGFEFLWYNLVDKDDELRLHINVVSDGTVEWEFHDTKENEIVGGSTTKLQLDPDMIECLGLIK